ncbi:MAG TPA: hypothetical protein VI875_02835, partial [Candidatus Norongarragalinales archaeon]|nr:hypothetical protein [Candidatus Norongarragalinales archaeon]
LCVMLDSAPGTLLENSTALRKRERKLWFVDGISRYAGYADLWRVLNEASNRVFLRSTSLVELSLAISDFMNEEAFDFLVFDSVSSLLSRNDYRKTTDFIDYLLEKTRNQKMTCVLLCNAGSDKTGRMLRELAGLYDNKISVS